MLFKKKLITKYRQYTSQYMMSTVVVHNIITLNLLDGILNGVVDTKPY